MKPYTKCPFCGTNTNKIKVFMMGTKSAFIDTDCCWRDQEVEWTKQLETIYGVYIVKKKDNLNKNETL